MIEGKDIILARIRAGRMKQYELATMLGIPKLHLSEIETGKCVVEPHIAKKLMNIFPMMSVLIKRHNRVDRLTTRLCLSEKVLSERIEHDGIKISLVRRLHDMKQGMLAYKLKIPQSYLSEMENGKRFIPDEVMENLKKIFPIDFGGNDGQ